MELLLEEVLGGSKGGDVSLDLPDCRVVLEDRSAGEAEELGVREELLDGLVVLAELRAVALVEDEDHPLVAELLEPLLERRPPPSDVQLLVLAVLVEGKPELLDGRDDDLVRVVVGFEAADKRRGIGVLLDAVLLEPIELLAGLAVEVLAVDDEEALVNALVGLEER